MTFDNNKSIIYYWFIKPLIM